MSYKKKSNNRIFKKTIYYSELNKIIKFNLSDTAQKEKYLAFS